MKPFSCDYTDPVANDQDELIDQIKRLEIQINKLAGENEDLRSRMHGASVGYDILKADAEESNKRLNILRDELAKAHATIDKLSNALVDRL